MCSTPAEHAKNNACLLQAMLLYSSLKATPHFKQVPAQATMCLLGTSQRDTVASQRESVVKWQQLVC
jgi:hypothetical protein